MKFSIVASLVAAAAVSGVQASPVGAPLGGLGISSQQAIMDAFVAAAEVSAKAALVSQYAQVAALNAAAGITDVGVLEQVSSAQAQVLAALESQYAGVGEGIVENAGTATDNVAIVTETITVTGRASSSAAAPSQSPVKPVQPPQPAPPAIKPVQPAPTSAAPPAAKPVQPVPTSTSPPAVKPPTAPPAPAPTSAPPPAPPAPAPTSAPPPPPVIGGGQFRGDGTYFSPGLGSCGKTNSDNDLIAAINAPQYGVNANPNEAEVCNKCAMVTGPLGSIKVTITDRCPVCKHGDLDLSPAAFDKIGAQVAGRVPISWSFVPC